MRKFLFFTFALIATFLLVNILYLWILEFIDWEFIKTKEAFSFRQQNHKVLVFGNSTAMDGINAEMLSSQFGPAYNFAVGGASLETNHIQLERYLQNNTKPEKVLVFLSSCHINYDRASEVNPIIDHYYSNTRFSIDLKGLPLFKFRWLFVENFKKLLSSDHRSAEFVKGQLRIHKTVQDHTLGNDRQNCQEGPDYSKPGYDYLRSIAATCDRENIELMVFEMPCWKKSQNDCADIGVSGVKDKIEVSNLNRAGICDTLLNPRTDWLSENHLNYLGAEKVTRLVEYIIKANDTPR